MPSLSPTMQEGTIVKWLKKEGDAVQPGDILCDIQTDKAVIGFEIEEEGILAKILVEEDSKDIKVGTLIAVMVEEGEDWKNVEIPVTGAKEVDTKAPEVVASAPKSQIKIENFGPSVRLLLEKYGLTHSQVPAEGPHGILLKGDVLKFVREKNLQAKPLAKVAAPPAPKIVSDSAPKAPSAPKVVSGSEYDDVEVTSMRRTIAKRLLQSKSTIAHTYSTLDCSLDGLLRMRKRFKAGGVAVSVNDLLIKAVAVALQRCPDINCVWEGGMLVQKPEVDISVAVATDAGLITPIVKGADGLGLSDITDVVRDLAARARIGKLRLDEFQGGTFTISNLGMFGIKEFSAIINPPQCGILAVGGGRITLDEEGKPETRMNATLSYDQAAISDDAAALFMETLKDLLENPQTILVGSFQRKVDHPMAALL
ncbi:UNVERIFIED_CONTAM: hypothetical protein GTU68_026945 [Idotea baltica]|nr:hypothetical protein [Idotea baltica]